jgi:hypothetical protein
MRMADDGDRTLSREIRTALVEHVAKADAVVEPAEAIERVSESMTFRRLTTTGLIRGGGTAGIRSAESASTTASEVPELRNNDIEDGDRHWPLCPPGHPPRSLRDLQNRWRRSRGFLFARPVRSWEASKVEILHATPTGNAQRSWGSLVLDTDEWKPAERGIGRAGGRSGRHRVVERHGAWRTQRLCSARPKVQSLRRHSRQAALKVVKTCLEDVDEGRSGMRKAFAALAIVAVCAVVGITATVALAIPLSNPGEAANCSTTSGTWHFVHNQTSATSGTLTAVIGGVTYTVSNTPSNSKNLHYHITAGGTLSSASDNVAGGNLLLSDCPEAPPPPPPPPPPV